MALDIREEEKGRRGVEETAAAPPEPVVSPSLQHSNTPTLHFTLSAIKQLKHLREKKGDSSLGVRVGVKGGGCSGLSYFLQFEGAPKEGDRVSDADGIRVWVDPKSARFIAGTTVDFSLANFLEGGFKFTNPNAAKSCGCGTSFTPKTDER